MDIPENTKQERIQRRLGRHSLGGRRDLSYSSYERKEGRRKVGGIGDFGQEVPTLLSLMASAKPINVSIILNHTLTTNIFHFIA